MLTFPPPVERAWDRLRPDLAGLVLGSVFFVLALTPSLIPRDILFQGVACGLCAATGYLVGVWLSWNWRTWVSKVVQILWEASGRSLPSWVPRWRRRVEFTLSVIVVLEVASVGAVWERGAGTRSR